MDFITFHNDWLIEPLRAMPDYREKRMFGGLAIYLGERMVVCLTKERDDEWAGILFPSDFDQHEAAMALFPVLQEHSVLPKWLYLPADANRFEEVATAVVARIAAGDVRFGCIPDRKKKRKRARKGASQDASSASGKKEEADATRDENGLTIPAHLRV